MDAIEVEGSEAIEVLAQFDGAVVDVQHLVRRDVDDERRARRFAVGGGVALALVLAAFLGAWAGAPLPRAADAVVALAFAGGLWALMRGLLRLDAQPPRDYTIGAAAHAHLAVAPGAVPLPAFPLVRVAETGDWELTFTRAMAGSLTVDGVTRALADAARPSSAVPDAGAAGLPPGARAWVRAGGATFHLANVPAPRRQLGAPAFDWRRQVHLAAVAAVVSAFVMLVYLVPPAPESLALDLVHDTHLARFALTPPAEPLEHQSGDALASPSGAGGTRSRGATGRVGRPDAPRRPGRLVAAGQPSRERVLAAAAAAARHAGVIDIIGGAQVGSVFGPGTALGQDAPAVLAGLQGVELVDGYGTGTALVGDGPGGGGDRDERTIGVGRLGGIGDNRLGPGGSGYAHGVGGLHDRRAHAPEVVPGIATVCGGDSGGCLDKEIIRRVIRQHRNEVRYCYDRALLAHPSLSGRVLAEFTIAPGGRVLAAAAVESSAGAEVGHCIATAIRRWEFPASRQTVTVSYPFILQSPR